MEMGLFNRSRTYPDISRNTPCSEFEVDNWVLSEFILDKIVPVAGIRPFPLNELMLMCATVCRYRPSLIFDWGTHIGKSARIFRETIKAFGIPCHIHSIDLPDDVEHVEHPNAERGRLVKGLAEVTLHQGDGVTTALEILRRNTNTGSTLFYVDGDHAYESVKRELSMILGAVPSAVVLLHDTFMQSESSGYNVGPARAIQEVLSATPGWKTIRTNTGLPGMTLVHPSA